MPQIFEDDFEAEGEAQEYQGLEYVDDYHNHIPKWKHSLWPRSWWFLSIWMWMIIIITSLNGDIVCDQVVGSSRWFPRTRKCFFNWRHHQNQNHQVADAKTHVWYSDSDAKTHVQIPRWGLVVHVIRGWHYWFAVGHNVPNSRHQFTAVRYQDLLLDIQQTSVHSSLILKVENRRWQSYSQGWE